MYEHYKYTIIMFELSAFGFVYKIQLDVMVLINNSQYVLILLSVYMISKELPMILHHVMVNCPISSVNSAKSQRKWSMKVIGFDLLQSNKKSQGICGKENCKPVLNLHFSTSCTKFSACLMFIDSLVLT